MKYLVRTVVAGGLLGLLAWGLVYVATEREMYGGAMQGSADWGIVKDSPLRPFR